MKQIEALPPSPFRHFNSSFEVIRLVVLMYVRFPLSLRNVENLLFERGIDVCHETIRFWWNSFGANVRRRYPPAAGQPHARVPSLAVAFGRDLMKLNDELIYLWRAVDHEGGCMKSSRRWRYRTSSRLPRSRPGRGMHERQRATGGVKNGSLAISRATRSAWSMTRRTLPPASLATSTSLQPRRSNSASNAGYVATLDRPSGS